MVAKPLCPLYKNIIKPLDRARYPELRYILNHDYSGLFLPKAGETCTIEWYKTGNTVSVTFTGEMAFLGTQILNYAEEGHFLIEKSEIYGYLKYTKQ